MSTNIAPKQGATEETPPKRHYMGQILQGQMLCPDSRQDKCRILPRGKRRKKTTVEMATATPRASSTKKVRCREDTAGEGGE